MSKEYTGPNKTSVTDEGGTETEYSYCPECGKLTGVSGPMSWALSWVLDSDKDVTTFRDALTHDTTYTYGSARELKQITYPSLGPKSGGSPNPRRFYRPQSMVQTLIPFNYRVWVLDLYSIIKAEYDF